MSVSNVDFLVWAIQAVGNFKWYVTTFLSYNRQCPSFSQCLIFIGLSVVLTTYATVTWPSSTEERVGLMTQRFGDPSKQTWLPTGACGTRIRIGAAALSGISYSSHTVDLMIFHDLVISVLSSQDTTVVVWYNSSMVSCVHSEGETELGIVDRGTDCFIPEIIILPYDTVFCKVFIIIQWVFIVVSPSNPSKWSPKLLVTRKSVWKGEIIFDSFKGEKLFLKSVSLILLH